MLFFRDLDGVQKHGERCFFVFFHGVHGNGRRVSGAINLSVLKTQLGWKFYRPRCWVSPLPGTRPTGDRPVYFVAVWGRWKFVHAFRFVKIRMGFRAGRRGGLAIWVHPVRGPGACGRRPCWGFVFL